MPQNLGSESDDIRVLTYESDYLAAAYEVDDAMLARAAVFWRVGPWHEVGYGLWTKRPEYVERGLAGIRERLPAATDDLDTMLP
jgi:hypothetical protein